MFTFGATPVKFIGLLILFTYCIVWGLFELRRAQNQRQGIAGSLHLLMSVVMLAMIPSWSWHGLIKVVPIWALVVIFAAATAWFGWLATDDSKHAGWRQATTSWAHTAMFLAMTWHLTGMAIKRHQMTMGGGMSSGGMSNGNMGGMGGMGGMSHSATASHGAMWWIAIIGVPIMTYLLVAAVLDLRKALLPRAAVRHDCACGDNCACGPDCDCPPAAVPTSTPERQLVLAGSGPDAVAPAIKLQPVVATASCHAPRPVGTPIYRLGALADFAMNFGMFWMSTGLLVAVIPFFAKLSF